MAIFHFSMKNIGRSDNRSAVAAAAYRAGTTLVDESTDQIHNYSKKQGVFHAEIIAPDESPFWVRDRLTLWNAVQQANFRKNARFCKEINIALPKEITHEAKLALVREFVGDEIVRRFGLVCDVYYHDFTTHNPHVHLMIPLRVADADDFGERVKEIDGRRTVYELRSAWATHANCYITAAGVREIDERSNKTQGIKREPEIHLGASAWALEQRGIKTELGNKNRDIREINREQERLRE